MGDILDHDEKFVEQITPETIGGMKKQKL